MKDEIRRYLDEYGTTYTPDALRAALLQAGHEAGEVDAALQEWGSEHARVGGLRRSFGQWSLLIYLGVLVAVFALTVLLIGTETGLAVIGAVVLVFFLLVALGVSTLLGRWLVPRIGLSVALLIPLIFAVGLGGTCLAIMGGMTPPRPASGTMELRIDLPLGFSGSGPADCFIELDGRSSSIYAGELGTLEGRIVGVSLNSFQVSTDPSAEQPASGPDAAGLYITLSPTGETDPGATYTSTVESSLTFENSADGRSGMVTFENLAAEPGGEPGVAPTDPISGTLEWRCEARP